MVFITDYQLFQLKSIELLQRDPAKTRYALKHRHSDNEAVIKVTNDVECYQFRINDSNAELAHDFIRDITFIFMKVAANRKGDDVGAGGGAFEEKKGGKNKKKGGKK
ncbi:signal recognition particle 9 kda protein [Stylonychia lemnae]|uniref:Signal recognition particle 9 kDa protein n=1 Tax=Stylonychia lemnae TaxID=5949 RepID=A0A078B9K7_STYLE|nr:signal recognition particle 9 kda protein [Stylonychia lemnae]|eukprot:CDW89932.1 signal recognition particle 9 kda protein [Stylonychia lemnae]